MYKLEIPVINYTDIYLFNPLFSTLRAKKAVAGNYTFYKLG